MANKNGWLNGIVAAILLTLPVGSVYAFSLFSSGMVEACGVSMQLVQYAFSLSIFFLGMGAAFFGPIVEKNPSRAGYIAATLYAAGMGTTAIGLKIGSYPLLLIGYGLLNGLGQGIAYLSPVKALIMWFPKHKGLAASVSIVSFGLGSTLCTFLAKSLLSHMSLCQFFGILAGLYCIMMDIGAFLLKKPEEKKEEQEDPENSIALSAKDAAAIEDKPKFSYFSLLTNKMFWHSWLFMFLNISAGLALIGCSVSIFKDATIPQSAIVILMMLAGIFNGAFRLIFAWSSDYLKTRIDMWFAISALSIVFLLAAGCSYPLIGAAILLINATYGGGFSTCPAVLSDYYDNTMLSRTHGAVLSAWAIAGLVGNNVSMAMFKLTGGFYWLIWLLVAVYICNIVNVYFARKRFKAMLELKTEQ